MKKRSLGVAIVLMVLLALTLGSCSLVANIQVQYMNTSAGDADMSVTGQILPTKVKASETSPLVSVTVPKIGDFTVTVVESGETMTKKPDFTIKDGGKYLITYARALGIKTIVVAPIP